MRFSGFILLACGASTLAQQLTAGTNASQGYAIPMVVAPATTALPTAARLPALVSQTAISVAAVIAVWTRRLREDSDASPTRHLEQRMPG
ncbi:hypothetical protein J7T55_011971 [Diaporthe amygdali]|uniref:uncharacterized protein n=1 Tax=Phomopsis amygdali TaxID=1214568 RepID=UPI0022FEECE6|nr:uncharacterized protein J7T55_011971 [Diaporthe amygdali]KAJ0123506.1 hypothetical protein J7T55_011971 [Diaporthe amygdali]